MTKLQSTAIRSNARRVRMNPGTPWWDASDQLRKVLEKTIGLTQLRVDRHFHSLTATYEPTRDRNGAADSPVAKASIQIRLEGHVIGDVLIQDHRRTQYDEQARATAAQIVDAFAPRFEDPSARVRATPIRRDDGR